MLAVPPALLEELHLQPGSIVGIAIEKGRLIVEPRKRRKYTLDQLIAESPRRVRRTKADREWVTGKPVGRELI